MRIAALMILLTTASVQAAEHKSFSLDDIAAVFPSKGFENEIGFWKKIFTQYGEKEILFHDSVDLRLVFKTVTVERTIRNDPDELRSQSKMLKGEVKKLSQLWRDISVHGPDSSQLDARHRRLLDILRENGLEPTAQLARELSQRVRYQRGIKEKFMEGLVRSGRYLDRIERIFESYGLPKELAMMPHVESSFDYDAYSKVAAVGMWQFMRGTGRRFMTINRYVDERRDPILSTDAAARYLRENFELLGSWPLAITAFNHGANGMARAAAKHGTDFRRIVDEYKGRLFGFASKNFYPEFLAAVEVARNYKRYFGEVVLEAARHYDTVQLKSGYDVDYFEKIDGLGADAFRAYNPHLTRYVWRSSRVIPAGVELRFPEGFRDRVLETLSKARPASASLSMADDGSMRYRVRSGNTLAWIASNFGTTIRNLQRLNNIRNPNHIRVGQVLTISDAPKDGVGRYRVRKGDSLAAIARRFGTTVRRLQLFNGLTDVNRIYPGQVLLIAAKP